MSKQFWNSRELRILEEWDWVITYIANQRPECLTAEDVERRILLEANLLIINKLLIVYGEKDSKPTGIISFKEFLGLREKRKGRINYHPTNFLVNKEYIHYLSTLRELILSGALNQ